MGETKPVEQELSAEGKWSQHGGGWQKRECPVGQVSILLAQAREAYQHAPGLSLHGTFSFL